MVVSLLLRVVTQVWSGRADPLWPVCRHPISSGHSGHSYRTSTPPSALTSSGKCGELREDECGAEKRGSLGHHMTKASQNRMPEPFQYVADPSPGGAAWRAPTSLVKLHPSSIKLSLSVFLSKSPKIFTL